MGRKTLVVMGPGAALELRNRCNMPHWLACPIDTCQWGMGLPPCPNDTCHLEHKSIGHATPVKGEGHVEVGVTHRVQGRSRRRIRIGIRSKFQTERGPRTTSDDGARAKLP